MFLKNNSGPLPFAAADGRCVHDADGPLKVLQPPEGLWFPKPR
jgi:hypothetical protein